VNPRKAPPYASLPNAELVIAHQCISKTRLARGRDEAWIRVSLDHLSFYSDYAQ
jgi:hypothetical protein